MKFESRTRRWRVMFRYLFAAACAMPLLASAQDIEGMQTQILIPIVVDSATYSTRVELFNPFSTAIGLTPTYVPGTGTTQASAGVLTCPRVVLPPGTPVTIVSIRALCPGLAPESQFGYLRLVRDTGFDPANAKYSQLGIHAYTRVSNSLGQGFSVESFPLNAMGYGYQMAGGLRRLAATASAPEYQTNCFVGSLRDPVTVNIQLTSASNSPLGNAISVNLQPNQLVRYLDIFAAAGLGSGNHDNAIVRFSVPNGTFGSYFGFCTVQDNRSFGADFRIAKTAVPADWNRKRRYSITRDALGRVLQLPGGSDYWQMSIVEARHPDLMRCHALPVGSTTTDWPGVETQLWVRNPATQNLQKISNGSVANPPYWSSALAAPKSSRMAGRDGTIYVVVQRTGPGAGTNYNLTCQNGSGLSYPVMVLESGGQLSQNPPTNPMP